MYVSKRLVILLLVALAAIVAAGFAMAKLTFVATPDGILVLYEKQAKECEEGGGCAIFSVREFEASVYQLLARQRRNSAPDT